MKVGWRICVVALLVLYRAQFAAADKPVESNAIGQNLAAGVVGVFNQPPARVPSRRMPDGPILGNGDLGVTLAGKADALTFYLGKADFFGVLKGAASPAGSLNLSIPQLRGATTYHIEQQIGQAKLVGHFACADGGALDMTSWVSDQQNLLVVDLQNSGDKPLEVASELRDRLGTTGNPATFSASGTATMLSVSPDTLDLQLGSPFPMHHPPEDRPTAADVSFKGSVADFAIFDRSLTGAALKNDSSAGVPMFHWTATSPAQLTAGASPAADASHANGPHPNAIVFDGSSTAAAWLGALLVPQKAYTLRAWVNLAEAPKGRQFIASACRNASQQLMHGVALSLIDGRAASTLNGVTISSPAALPVGQWVHIATTYDGTALALFIDGSEVASTTQLPTAAEVMGADKGSIRFGDPSIPWQGCSPRALALQSVMGCSCRLDDSRLAFTLLPHGRATILLSLVSNHNSADFEAIATRIATQTDEKALADLETKHDQWWNDFWSRSFVNISDKLIQDNWYGSLYLLACCSRPECPPPGLWGNFVTSADNYWNGDYTLDYNYEGQFWAAYFTNHLELAENYDEPLLDYMSRGFATAAKYKQKGLYYRMHLIPPPGWNEDGSFEHQRCGTLFAAVDCVMRWRLTYDLKYAKKIYPYLKGTADYWNNYLVFQNGRYVDLDDGAGENKQNDNPATTLSFLRLLYPALIDISQRLNIDQDCVAKWNDILHHLSPLPIVPAASVNDLDVSPPNAPRRKPGQRPVYDLKITLADLLGTEAVKDRIVIRNGETGWGFPYPEYKNYHDGNEHQSGPGMNSTQVIFPGWSIGMESSDRERKAALDTVTLAAEWCDWNDQCCFYAAAANAGYDPREILANLHQLIARHSFPNLMITGSGGGVENFSVTPAALSAMFIQSYQSTIHLFPNWPAKEDAAFGNFNACGGFLISSSRKSGTVLYVEIKSLAGRDVRLANPWPGKAVTLKAADGAAAGSATDRLSSGVLVFPTRPGAEYRLTSAD
jgi:hypothetical protein